jgi:cytoskeletal protein CcmA (bactofilin family)
MPEQITKTIIAPGITINGNIVGEGDIEIHGHVVGDVKTSHGVVLADGGQLEGKVECSKIVVGGYLQGDVVAKEAVEVGNVGVLLGKVKAPRLQLADGAAVQGEIEMPLSDNRKPLKSQLKPVSVTRTGTEAPAETNGSH